MYNFLKSSSISSSVFSTISSVITSFATLSITLYNIYVIRWTQKQMTFGLYYQSFAQKGIEVKYIDYDYSPTQ